MTTQSTPNSHQTLPTQGLSHTQAIDALKAIGANDMVPDGKKWAMKYDAGQDVTDVAEAAFVAFMGKNGLDPTLYPSFQQLENDVVGACARHLGGDEHTVGTITSCGTESVLLSVKTARDHVRSQKDNIHTPNMVLPITAHASFQKAAQYFGLEVILVDIDPVTMRADVEDMAAKINDQTVLIVGSAPSYAHGVIDPIEEMGQLALKHQINLHVDACIGGWVLPFQRKFGVEVPPFDFHVDGVSSISVDLHKYAFAPKGVSCLLHKNDLLRQSQYYACASWTGYSIVNATMMGSKSGAPLAAAWAVMHYLGEEGYIEKFKAMWQTTCKLIEAINASEHVEVIGQPNMPLMAIRPTHGDAFELADRLNARGWFTQATFGYGPSPAHLHLTIDPACSPFTDDFIAAVIEEANALTPPEEQVDDQTIHMIKDLLQQDIDLTPVLESFGVQSGALPQDMADLNRIMDALDSQTRETLLKTFFQHLFQPSTLAATR